MRNIEPHTVGIAIGAASNMAELRKECQAVSREDLKEGRRNLVFGFQAENVTFEISTPGMGIVIAQIIKKAFDSPRKREEIRVLAAAEDERLIALCMSKKVRSSPLVFGQEIEAAPLSKVRAETAPGEAQIPSLRSFSDDVTAISSEAAPLGIAPLGPRSDGDDVSSSDLLPREKIRSEASDELVQSPALAVAGEASATAVHAPDALSRLPASTAGDGDPTPRAGAFHALAEQRARSATGHVETSARPAPSLSSQPQSISELPRAHTVGAVRPGDRDFAQSSTKSPSDTSAGALLGNPARAPAPPFVADRPRAATLETRPPGS